MPGTPGRAHSIGHKRKTHAPSSTACKPGTPVPPPASGPPSEPAPLPVLHPAGLEHLAAPLHGCAALHCHLPAAPALRQEAHGAKGLGMWRALQLSSKIACALFECASVLLVWKAANELLTLVRTYDAKYFLLSRLLDSKGGLCVMPVGQDVAHRPAQLAHHRVI
eukprot:scaffold56443_cov19-Tisochrysis_lutea.AAC.1